jgi:general secretion pathway protein H
MKSTNRNGGFTLVELLVVLSLLAVIAVISLPYSVASGDARKLDAIAQVVAAKLRESQTSALFTNRESVLGLDLRSRILSQAGANRTYVVPGDMEIQILTAENEVLNDSAAFRFFPEGGSTGGKIILSKANLKREIAINWLTGAIVVSAGETP